jgi:hypothetical protein
MGFRDGSVGAKEVTELVSNHFLKEALLLLQTLLAEVIPSASSVCQVQLLMA